MTINETEIAYLCGSFRSRAETYMCKAREAQKERDVGDVHGNCGHSRRVAWEVRWALRLPGLTKIRIDQAVRERLLADVVHDREDLQT